MTLVVLIQFVVMVSVACAQCTSRAYTSNFVLNAEHLSCMITYYICTSVSFFLTSSYIIVRCHFSSLSGPRECFDSN